MNLNVNWQLRIKSKVYKELNKFSRKDGKRIIFAIKQLPLNLYAGDTEKMEGENHVWRRRIGSYRIFYEIKSNEKIIYVYHIERRTSNTY